MSTQHPYHHGSQQRALQVLLVLFGHEIDGLSPSQIAKAVQASPSAISAEARKARALWLMLHELGQVRDPSERALGSYCKRVLKVDALQWTDGQIWRLIESLKDWAMRVLPARCEAMRQQVDAMGLPPEKTAGVRQALREMSVDRLGRRKPRFDHYHALYAALLACMPPPAKEPRA